MIIARASSRRCLGTLVLAASLVFGHTATGQSLDDYERGVRLNATELLPGGIPLESDLYAIDEHVDNDGFTNHYRLFSPTHGAYFVAGDERILERLHELYVISELEEVKRTEAFADGMKEAGKSTWQNMKTAITNPVDTVRGIPSGVSRFFGNAFRSVRRGRRSEYEDSVLQGVLGHSRVKRQVAFEFEVDPYSSNEALQGALNEVAWAGFAGGMSLTAFRALAVPRGLNTPILATELAGNVSTLVRDESPESLQKINADKLDEVGCDKESIEAFLRSTHISPFRETVIAEALYGMRQVDDVCAYLGRAIDAASEDEAFYVQRNAELLHEYHTDHATLKQLHMPANVPIAETVAGELVGVFAVDHLLWTRELHQTVLDVREQLPEELAELEIQVWVGGTASEKAKEALASLGFAVTENALAELSSEERA